MTEASTAGQSTETATGASGRAPRAPRTSRSSGSDPSEDAVWAEVVANLERAGWKLVRADEADETGLDLSRYRSAVVRSVYGPFNSRTLVDMPTAMAFELFPDGMHTAQPADNLTAALAELDAIDAIDPDLARSSLAALLVQMARELDHPYNSATSKAACASQLVTCRAALMDLLPEGEEGDALDDLIARFTASPAPDGGAEASVSVDAESLLDR